MITPRRTRLLHVSGLRAFRHAIVGLSSQAGDRSRLVVVSTSEGGRQLRRTIGDGTAVEIATRDGLYDALHARLHAPPLRLTGYDRNIMVYAAARDGSTPFSLRPGLIAEILRFYDQLRRQAQNVSRFEELLDDTLSRDVEHDRGADRMLAQTRFLASTFQGYERRVQDSGACDEHTLREQLIALASPRPVRQVVVTVGDWIADPNGLYLADFDLLTRLPGLESVDIIATDGLLGSGLHQRIREWLPGIEEVEAADLNLCGKSSPRPILMVPGVEPDRLVFVRRDREEELIAIARDLKANAPTGASLERTAVVFRRPLPYLYLAREVFGQAGLSYQACDALPLAAEPAASALDLIFEFVESGFTRASIIALLRSPHFRFEHESRRIGQESVSALDRLLSEKRYLGTVERLAELEATAAAEDEDGARLALHAALTAATMLVPLAAAAPASAQFRCLIGFLDAYDIVHDVSRLRRGRAAVRGVITALAAAHEAHDDAPVGIADMAAGVRRWIEEQTFLPDTGGAGIQLLDDQAARYGEFDDIALVGLIEGEWPDRPSRNIFYPNSLLAALGWPTEKDRRRAAEARFLELLQSPFTRVTVSTVSLDDEALVEPSTFVDEITRAGLSATPVECQDEAVAEQALDSEAEGWTSMRATRSLHDAAEFHGRVGPIAQRVWSVSSLETYLACPFKFFAQYILKLEEEPEDEEVMDPRRRGQFVHDVFEAFFGRWRQGGHQAVTPETIGTARAVFHEVVEESLDRLSDTEAALERTRLLGSSAAVGLGEAAFHMEAERPVPVVDRLLKRKLRGEFEFATADGVRRLSLSGKPDRIDLLADGTFCVIDYRLGWPPNKARAFQLPIYGVCAEQSLDGYLGRRWTLGELAYLAFEGPNRVVRLSGSDAERLRVLRDAQQRLVDTVEAIQVGRFPPAPDDVYRCETCTYAAVCRKDYAVDV